MAVKLKKGQVLGALSITPLIDVVFLLLIFFLVASRLSEEDREINIALPSSANAMPMTTEPQEMIVNITDRGVLFVNGEYMDIERFEQVLRQAIANNPIGQRVIIRGDRRVPFQHPIDVMSVCNKLGASFSATVSEEGSG